MPGSMRDRILRIECGEKKASPWEVPGEVREYIGGIGYGTKILFDEVDPRIDPLDPANKIVLTVGPLTGTAAPMHPQACIVTKSPLSGTILNCYAGGFLGAEIKFAGIDGIIFEGRCDEWSLVLIDNDEVRFVDASPVLGTSTEETESYIKNTYGSGYRTLSIGPAGEKGVAMGSIFSETRTFGRGGAGAVLGSKRIKGVGIRGSVPVDVYDRKEFSRCVADNMTVIMSACDEEYNLVGLFSRFGTGAGMSLVQSRGGLPTRNHQKGAFEGADLIDGQRYEKDFYTKWVSCFSCPVHCGRVHRYKDHGGKDAWARGPEYETMYSLGSNLENRDPDVLAEANRLTEEYGMDSLTVGVTIAWALEMGERGLIDEPGIDLEFGKPETVLALLHKIGKREGIGDTLALGPAKAAEKIGAGQEFAMQVKNSGFAAWMPRRMKGTGLAFATSNRGACHKRAPIGAEIIGAVDMDSYEGKAEMVIGIQNTVNAVFTLISCRFHEFVTDHDCYPRYLKAAVGRDMSWEEFVRIGERTWNLERLFNVRAGLTKQDDMLPERCFEPIVGEASEAAVMDKGRFTEMLEEYYSLRGWDRDGVPGGEKLRELGISGR